MAHLEAEYLLETHTVPSFIGAAEFDVMARECVMLPSDSYVCHGSRSQGSGRSVVKGRHQLKGVGRTLHAGYHSFHRDVNGALSLRDAAVEAFHEKRLRNVLATPPLPVDFILLPTHATEPLRMERRGELRADIRCVMGRRGSPLRLGHLEALASELRTVKESMVGSYLAHLVLASFGGVPSRDIEGRLVVAFDSLLLRAVRLSAESQVYSLCFSCWPDNFDLFSRPVDVAETWYRFPEPLRDITAPPAPGATQTPSAWFRELHLTREHELSSTLYPIKNVFSAIHLVARECSMDRTALAARYSWDWLRDAYRDEVIGAVARILGIAIDDVRDEAVMLELRSLAERFPLPGGLAAAVLPAMNWHTVLQDIAAGAHGVAHLARMADASRGTAFRARIDRANCERDVAALETYLDTHLVQPCLDRGLDALPAGLPALPHLVESP